MANGQVYTLALIKSFPLGLVVICIAIYALVEAIEMKWERRKI